MRTETPVKGLAKSKDLRVPKNSAAALRALEKYVTERKQERGK